MARLSRTAFPCTTPARLVADQVARAKAHADIAALVRASLEELRQSERALEEQLGDLQYYLGREDVVTVLDARAN